jgi:hypothetical protein
MEAFSRQQLAFSPLASWAEGKLYCGHGECSEVLAANTRESTRIRSAGLVSCDFCSPSQHSALGIQPARLFGLRDSLSCAWLVLLSARTHLINAPGHCHQG